MKKIIQILKKKLKNYNPKLKEECGVFGISNSTDASALTALGLHALQHRGQEGCGIVSFDGKKYHSEKRFGLVGDNFNKEKVLKNLNVNPKTFTLRSTSSLIKDSLRKKTSDAYEKGIFGAPTFIANNKIFWGQDRIEFALNEARK